MKNWVNGIPYEIAFWKAVYANKKSRERLFRWSKYSKEFELDNFDVKEFLSRRENPVIVDAGCGMSFCYGGKLNGKPLNVHYIDPLAPFFNKIIEDKKLDLPKISFGFIEYLSAFVPGKVSLIIVQNALDHSKNPLKGIMECIESLEIGGVLYLRHHPNEAETENYRGFHQYNISVENSEMIIWNRKEQINVNAFVKEFADTQTGTYNNEVVTVITKKQELPEELVDCKKDIADLCSQYIDVIRSFNNVKYSFLYHLNFLRFRVVQFCVQMLSWQTRQKIKKLIKK